MKKIIFLLTITFGLSTLSNAQTKEIKLKGIYKEIDVTRHNDAIAILNGENKKLKQQTVAGILKNPNFYNPPVLYALSHELFEQDKKDEASYWFYVAQLRARYDANLCTDNSAKQAVSVLNNEYGSDINVYAFKNIDQLEKTITKVVDFVKANAENYDHRWINLHGMGAVIAGMSEDTETKALSQPEDKWAAIKKKTIDEYYNGFVEYVKSKK
ncbi:hypothetical protein ACFSX9_11805 [Flavobacterium ardleyense]|uniref:Uncharacterized protein n=1 Tax=Flavobacterium ardleyense TaxID=2038737 RepID=A0ABW5ZB23_9FLAO